MDEPLVAHAKDARLSPAIQRMRSWTCRWWASSPQWAMIPASSRSEMEIVPLQWSAVTRSRCMSWGKGCRQTTGGASGSSASNQTPPVPRQQASHAPRLEGARGTSSMRQVGRNCKESAMARKSSMAAKTCRFRRTRFLSARLSASCNAEKRPRAPGKAIAMERSSSPRIWCHCCVGNPCQGGGQC